MASASSFQSSMALRVLPAPQTESHLVALRANLILLRHPSSRPFVAFSRRRGKANSTVTYSKKKKQRLPHSDVKDSDEDAFEALFSQLEEDLKNDDPFLDDSDEEIRDEDLAKLECELGEAIGNAELLAAFDSPEDDVISSKAEDDIGQDDDEDDEEEQPLELKNWQLRRLAQALKNGRRKTSIKSLAGDVCLDRAVVLQLLRDPPPNLLFLSVSLPDEPISIFVESKTIRLETEPSKTAANVAQLEAKEKPPVHFKLGSWSTQKRLKKVQVETLERVYARTKRPTNTMISSIVHVTNLPRKRVVKWFEDKRAEDGVPDRRLPYQRSAPETVFN